MAEVMHSQGAQVQWKGADAPPARALTVREVVTHVARMHSPTSDPAEQLMDTVDACVQLGASRHMLSAGLATQEALDQLSQIALGREVAHRLASTDRQAVEAIQSDMRARLAHILTSWWQAGERFTQLTRLLPAQLSSVWPGMPALDSDRRAALERNIPPDLAHVFQSARDRQVSAQRRCVRAVLEVERSLLEHRRLDQAFRAGQCPAASLAQTLQQLQRQLESRLNAEADRLAAQHVMELLARPVRTPSHA